MRCGRSLVFLMGISFVFSGCSGLRKEVNQNIMSNLSNTKKLYKKSSLPRKKLNTNRIQVVDEKYIGTDVIQRSEGPGLPIELKNKSVTIVSATPENIITIAHLITKATNIPVVVNEDVMKLIKDMSKNRYVGERNNSIKSPGTVFAGVNSTKESAVYSNEITKDPMSMIDVARGTMEVKYKGPLSAFLNMVSAHFNVGWSYNGSKIHFFYYVTRTFNIAAFPSISDSSASLSAGLIGNTASSGTSSSGNTGSDQKSSVKISMDLWRDISSTIKQIISNTGTLSVAKSMSSVTVRAPYNIVADVASYVRNLNRRLLRQVTIAVKVYRIKIKSNSKFAVSMALQYLLGGKNKVQDDASNTVTLGGSALLNLSLGKGKFAGSKIGLELNDSLGKVSVVTSASITTMSGQPVPLQISNTRDYVNQVGVNYYENQGSAVSVSTNSVSTGFSINLIPQVQDDGKILMQYGINISELVGPVEGFRQYVYYGDGGKNIQKLQLVDLDQRSFIQQALMKNGDTLVLAGFSNVKNTNNIGKGDPNFSLLGGSKSADKERSILVITMTPSVLQPYNTMVTNDKY